MKPLEVLRMQLQEVITSIEDQEKESKSLVDSYWVYFKFTNTQIMQERNQGLSTRKVGCLAPRVIRRGRGEAENKKVYVEWFSFGGSVKRTTGKTSKGKSTHRYSERITPSKEEAYSDHLLRKSSTGWEVSAAIELEHELKTYRESLNTLNDCAVLLRRKIRKLENSLTTVSLEGEQS